MKTLNRLDVENFLTIDDSSIEFDDLNFIVGKNGQGKTTIRHAVEFLFCGTARMTKGSNISIKNLINDESDETSLLVKGNFTDGYIKRRRSKSSSALKFSLQGIQQPEKRDDPTKTQKQQAILDHHNVTKEGFHYLLDGDDYASLSPDDRRRELFRLFGGGDSDTIAEKINESEIDDKLKEFCLNEVDDDTDIDTLIETFVQKRRDAKRDRNNIDPDDYSVPDVITFKINGDQKELAFEQALHIRDKKLKPKLSDARDSKNELEKDGLNFQLSESSGKLKKERDDVQEKIENAPDLNKILDKISSLKAEKKNHKKRLKMADDGKGSCVFDESKDCPVDEQTLDNFSDNMKEKIRDIDEKIDKLESNETKIRDLRERYKKLDSKLDALPTDDEFEKHEAVCQRINDLERAIEKINQAESNADDRKKAEEELETSEKTIEASNIIIDELKSIKGDLLPIEDYRGHLNKIGRILGENFSIDESGEILMNDRPPEFLSSSEYIRLQYAHQITLNELTDVGFLAFDYVEELDKENRKRFMKLLKEFRNSFTTVFVLIARDINSAPLDANLINVETELT